MTQPLFDLLLITDRSLPRWLEATAVAIAHAAPRRMAIEVRAEGESAGARALLELTEQVVALAAPRRIPVLVNDRIDVAIAARADGVHLKESSLSVERARALLGARSIVGASCHDAAGVARRHGADYLVLGPFGVVPGKGLPLGADRFAEIARDAGPPVLALGGLDAASTASAIRAGARGIAVTRAILASDDPARATLELIAALDAARRRA